MIAPKDDGGAAFTVGEAALMRNLQGMTLRDHFAGQAIGFVYDHCTTPSRAAEEAYRIADAMIKARSA